MEKRVKKSVRYLALGIFMYPFLYMVLNFVIPLLMAALGGDGTWLIELLQVFTWFIMPLFSIFYLLAFHHFSILLGKWHRLIGYVLVSVAVILEVVIPWLDSGLVSKVVSFLCPLFEMGILLSCMFAFSCNFKLSTENRKHA